MASVNAKRTILEYRELNKKVLVSFRLTRKEMEVALLLTNGITYSDMARIMHLTVHTVKFHSGNVFRKCKVHSKQEFCLKVLLLQVDLCGSR